MIRLLVSVLTLCFLVNAQAPTPGFNLTIDGDGFSNAKVVLKPMVAPYANNYWLSKKDPRITRVVLNSSADGPELQISVPNTTGTFVFEHADEDREDRNPYLLFYLLFPNDRDPSLAKTYRAERIEVTITKFDAPGGRIEGTVKGKIYRSLYRGSEIATLNGTFSVVRAKDRVVD